LSSSTIAIEMGKGHCSPGIAQGNGGRKKGGAGKENGVDTSTGGSGSQNLLKTGGIRTRKQALSDAEILQQLEADCILTGADQESTRRAATNSNRKRKMIQKGKVMQHVLVPPKAVENNMGLPLKEDEVRTTRGALGRRMRPSPRVVDQETNIATAVSSSLLSRSEIANLTTSSPARPAACHQAPARPATPHKIIRVEKPDKEESSSATSIRRSERKPESVLVKKLLSTTDDSCLGIEIFDTVHRGRGIKASRRFVKGDYVVEYAGDLLSESDALFREAQYQGDPTKGSYMYFFEYKGKQHCVDATEETGRYGRLINHSLKKSNCATKVVAMEDSPRLILVAKHDIEVGVELLFDYGERNKDTIKANPWLAE